MKSIDQMTDLELQEEMKRRQAAKENDRKAYKELVNDTVPGLINTLKWVSETLQKAKLETFKGVTDLLELKEKAYNIKDDQRSHTFTTENGDSLTLGYRVNDGWDDTVGTGIAKVGKFIDSLARDEESAKLVKTINQLLKKDNKGNLKSNRVIELQKLTEEFNNAEFTDGVNIIMKAYAPVKTCFFIEASTKDKQGKDVNIPLSISSVDFPEGTELRYFEEKVEETVDA
ncbi:MAG: DUF3164 family protein [Christiangramia sp.]|uniref:DUF3164 family protein n=1 Tax=Christiangramia sp. TaxID=1931228 RepID=UPI003242712C